MMLGLPLFVAGCGMGPDGFDGWPGFGGGYGSISDGGFVIPALDTTTIDSSLLRRSVAWRGTQRPGSIVVNIPERKLYLIAENGRALRYSVGVGRAEGLNFRGSAVIGRKEKWPRWTPTANMMVAMPQYRAYAGGMPGGLEESARRAGAVFVPRRRRHLFPAARHHRAGKHRPRRFQRLYPPVQPRHHRSVRARADRYNRHRGAELSRKVAAGGADQRHFGDELLRGLCEPRGLSRSLPGARPTSP